MIGPVLLSRSVFFSNHREVPSLNLCQLFSLKLSVVLLGLSGYMPEFLPNLTHNS
jgi:hypothetical protein